MKPEKLYLWTLRSKDGRLLAVAVAQNRSQAVDRIVSADRVPEFYRKDAVSETAKKLRRSPLRDGEVIL